MKVRIYLSGRITGYPDFKEHFGRVEEKLKLDKRYIILNPAVLPGGLSQGEYMSICLPMLHICDMIIMLKGWETSVGANIEYNLAKQVGKVIIFEEGS